MVERILAAGREVLVDDGYDAFTTNRVATRAGISPGSLYQYFSDKVAIVEAVTDRWTEEVSERVAASLTERLGVTGRPMVRGVVDGLLAAVESDPELLRVVTTELPGSRYRARRQALRRRIAEVTTAALAGRGTRRPDAATSGWLLVVALEALAVQWVLEPPPARAGETPADQRDRIVEELTDLCLAYLASAGTPASSVETPVDAPDAAPENA